MDKNEIISFLRANKNEIQEKYGVVKKRILEEIVYV